MMSRAHCIHAARRYVAAMLVAVSAAGFHIEGSCAAAAPGNGRLAVASLHPLVADLAREIGAGAADVWSVMPSGGDPHAWEPSPRDLIRLGSMDLVLASGKNLEPYLTRLVGQLGNGVDILEVGRTIQSVRIEAGSELFVCCPAHSVGSIDPHWWHSVPNWRKAGEVLTAAFREADPENAARYAANYEAFRRRMVELDRWVRAQVNTIPRSSRTISTAHLAYSYFAREYGFQQAPVRGLDAGEDVSAAYLREIVEVLRKHRVTAVFPEHLADRRVIERIADEAGVRIGGELIADGTGEGAGASFEGMMRHNVATLAAALR